MHGHGICVCYAAHWWKGNSGAFASQHEKLSSDFCFCMFWFVLKWRCMRAGPQVHVVPVCWDVFGARRSVALGPLSNGGKVDDFPRFGISKQNLNTVSFFPLGILEFRHSFSLASKLMFCNLLLLYTNFLLCMSAPSLYSSSFPITYVLRIMLE